MKVLHLCHGSPHLSPSAGGTERYAAAIAAGQGADLLAPHPSHRDGVLRREAVPGLWSIGLAPPEDFRRTWSRPEADAAVSELVAQLGPDVVHVHHLAHLGFGSVQAARDAGAALVLSLHDYHLACARGQLVDRSLSRCEGPSVDRCGHCVAEHLRATPRLRPFGRFASQLGLRGLARAAVAQLAPGPAELTRIERRIAAGKAVLSSVDRVLSPSRHLGECLTRLGWLPEEQWHLQDLPLVSSLSPAPAPPPGPVRFLFVGHLIPTKGVDVLVDAWTRVEGGTLTLRGPFAAYDGRPGWEDDLRARLEQLPSATWKGPFDAEERQAIYEEADVLVVPSTWEENSPLVVREARAVGLRVVASDVGGVPELDPHARRVPPGDPTALATALQAEVAAGRGRREPRSYPLQPHLEALSRHYAQAVQARRAGGRQGRPQGAPDLR